MTNLHSNEDTYNSLLQTLFLCAEHTLDLINYVHYMPTFVIPCKRFYSGDTTQTTLEQ